MTEAARSALVNINTNRQGATPPPSTTPEVLHELAKLGYLGNGNGLTRKGTIRRQLVMDELMNDMFGEI